MSAGAGDPPSDRGRDRVTVPARVERWRQAWQGGDARAVAALYASAGTHASAVVAAQMKEIGRSHLVGPAEIEAYAARVFAAVSELAFEIQAIVSDERRDVVEYLRRSSLDTAGPKPVVEILDWEGDRLASVRVYHF